MTKPLPKKLMDLKDSYSGDESWENFADCFDVNEHETLRIANNLGVSWSVAKVIGWHIREQYAEQWFNKKIPALHNFRPVDLIKNYEDGEICLRVMLRRMH